MGERSRVEFWGCWGQESSPPKHYWPINAPKIVKPGGYQTKLRSIPQRRDHIIRRYKVASTGEFLVMSMERPA